MIKKIKAQALVEFVIMIPLFLIFFAGVMQFAQIFLAKIKLAILEREVMMYLISDKENEDKIQDFIQSYSKEIGLNYNNLNYSFETIVGDMDKKSNFLKKFFNKFLGGKIKLEYKQELIPLFSALTRKRYIYLKTDLYTAHGGSFHITFDNIKETVVGIFKIQKEK